VSDGAARAVPRILHAPINVSGGPGSISAGLRAVGCESTLLVFNERPFVRGYDRNLQLIQGRGLLGLARNLPRQARATAWALRRFDVLHFHFGQTLLPRAVDARLARRLGRGVVFHFWGSDIRDRPPEAVSFLRHADAAIVGSFLTRRRAPRGPWPEYAVIPPAIDLTGWEPAPPAPGERVRLAHAPSRRAGKGTDAVLQAVEALRAEGAPVELDLIEGVPHAEARARYAQADVVIDQVRLGWYGLTSIEAMALGKPVVCHLDPDAAAETEEAFGHPLPHVRADAAALTGVLRELVRDRERLPELGRASRAYAEAVHASERVAERVLAVYRAAGII
jgi:glycosyltransferase involved in cell wall biosynthesis